MLKVDIFMDFSLAKNFIYSTSILSDYKVFYTILPANRKKEGMAMKDFFSNPKEEEYLSEFKQKVAQEMQDDLKARERDLERSRNGLIGSIAGVVLAFLVSWFILLPHFGLNQNKEIPIIRRPILPVKIQPSEPGGMEIANQDKTVYSLVEKNETLDTKVESLLPPPEAPQMPVISAEEVEETVGEAGNKKGEKELIQGVSTTATEQIKVPAKLSVIDVNVLTTNEPLTVKEKTEEKEPENVQNTVQAQVKEQNVPEAKPEPAVRVEEVKKAEIKTPVIAKGTWYLQLMASTQKAAVEKGYQTLMGQYPNLKSLSYRIETGADGLNRLKVGAFNSRDEADKLCGQIKAKGGTCLVKQN